jgi:hypothetical protein
LPAAGIGRFGSPDSPSAVVRRVLSGLVVPWIAALASFAGVGARASEIGRRGTLMGVKWRSQRTICVLQAVRRQAHMTDTNLI